eukprot:6881224-Pyramimonas_sp.AAC.1
METVDVVEELRWIDGMQSEEVFEPLDPPRNAIGARETEADIVAGPAAALRSRPVAPCSPGRAGGHGRGAGDLPSGAHAWASRC